MAALLAGMRAALSAGKSVVATVDRKVMWWVAQLAAAKAASWVWMWVVRWGDCLAALRVDWMAAW